jgi:RNA polymerase sigma-70 factor (ECF subfamily)
MEGALKGAKDWAHVVALYDQLLIQRPSVIVELNRAVAVSMVDGPEKGLAIVNRLFYVGGLDNYGLAHSTRAEFCHQLGMAEEARASYNQALSLTTQAAQRRFLEARLHELSQKIEHE